MAFFSFNGVTKDYVRVLRGLERPAWAPIEHEILEIPGRPGGLITGKKIKIRQINIPVRVYTKGFESLQKAKEDLAAWLITDEPKELIFSDEPDRVYYAQVTGELNLDELVEWGEGVISFICPDPYKYGPLRTQTINVPPASFSRNSIAYLSDGTQVSANQPRFEQGGVMVEEGATNLVGNPSFEIDTTGWAFDPMFTRSNAEALFGSYSLALTNPTRPQSSFYDVTVSPNTVYTVSCYVKNGLDVSVRMDVAQLDSANAFIRMDGDVVSASASSSTWVRLVKTVTTLSNAAKIRIRLIVDSAGTGTVYWDGVQVEQKPYATSFVDGTRQPETLTLPTDGVLNNDAFTIEMWIKCSIVTTSAFIHSATLLNLGNGLRIWNFSPAWSDPEKGDLDARRLIVEFGSDDSGNRQYLDLTSSTRFSTTEFEHFAITFDGAKFKFYRNGALWGEKQPAKINIFSKIAFEASGWFIGRPLRISRIARSDAEILDTYQNGFTVDEHTTAYLPFDGSLEVQTPNIVVNEGTAETYPTFTAYVKQPITFLDIISPDSYMRVGQPYATDQTPADGEKRVLNDNMSTLTGWGSATTVDGGIVQGSFHVVNETFRVQSYGPTYNGWAGPALKKSVPSPIQDFQVKALIDITSSANGVGRIEIYGLDAANNFVFRMGIGDFSAKSKDVKAYWELGPSTDTIFTTYGKKKGMLNDYYGILVIRRKGNKWTFYTARRTSAAPVANYVDYVQSTYVDTKNKYTGQLAQIQIHIGTHLGYGPISHMSINHIEVFELRNPAADQIPYIAYPDDVLQFDHKNAVIYRNGEPIMSQKDFGARFFPLAPGATELAVNPSDAAVVTIDYRPRYK